MFKELLIEIRIHSVWLNIKQWEQSFLEVYKHINLGY